MTQYIPATEVAKMARAALKEAFPGVKFSVRKSPRSGTLNIEWTDGPSTAAVDAITDQFAGEGFDGMTDMRYSRDNGTTPDGEPICYMTDFVFTHRNISPDLAADLRFKLAGEIAEENNIPLHEVMQDNRYWPAPQTIMRECDRCPEAPLYSFVIMLAEARATVQA
jgi:hypothetical protein